MDTALSDKVREYWDSNPCNIRHSSKKVGTREYFEEVTERKYFVEPHIRRFADFENWRGKKVLEIGCGIGTDTMEFARAGAWVTAVELSKRSLELAQSRAKVFNLSDHVKFYNVNAEELSGYVPVEPYDLIYSFGVIHHSVHPEKIIEEIQKYTKPGTIVKIMVYHRHSWKVLWILLKYGHGAFWKLKKLVADNSEAQFGSPVTYTYTKAELKNLFKGFKITEVFVDHIFPYKIPEYRNYQYKKVWYFSWMPAPLFRWLERHFGWHLCITAVKE